MPSSHDIKIYELDIVNKMLDDYQKLIDSNNKDGHNKQSGHHTTEQRKILVDNITKNIALKSSNLNKNFLTTWSQNNHISYDRLMATTKAASSIMPEYKHNRSEIIAKSLFDELVKSTNMSESEAWLSLLNMLYTTTKDDLAENKKTADFFAKWSKENGLEHRDVRHAFMMHQHKFLKGKSKTLNSHNTPQQTEEAEPLLDDERKIINDKILDVMGSITLTKEEIELEKIKLKEQLRRRELGIDVQNATEMQEANAMLQAKQDIIAELADMLYDSTVKIEDVPSKKNIKKKIQDKILENKKNTTATMPSTAISAARTKEVKTPDKSVKNTHYK
ncbi:hypothetical protein CAXC1_70019 [Candidatus Xenohaliotis californiensis]|uniref:Uncharacterized protein n=1 Tax=Candidatus Xenohaliotis californiensis TaxID=84677 RepID=A0ABM9N926_9RICK|nr:hypothetical protein CAXC1_70019 [Candidatus Xenohaliotis californiensis]